MKKTAVLLSLSLQLFISSIAVASPIYVFPFWDNTRTESVANEMQFADDDLSLTVSAWRASYNDDNEEVSPWIKVIGQDLGVYRDENGLGAFSVDGDGNDLDAGTVGDSDDPDEGLLFVFSEQVTLLDVFVGDLSSNDEINFSLVELLSPTQLELKQSVYDQPGPSGEEEWPFMFNQSFTGSAFMLWLNDDEDDVEVLGIAVTKVPEPSSVLLLAVLLLAFARVPRKI
jgi:hypothetical protein